MTVIQNGYNKPKDTIDSIDPMVEDIDMLELAEGENSQYADVLQDMFEDEWEEDTKANEPLIVLRSYMEIDEEEEEEPGEEE
ncbi:hypothetical protein DFQ28_003662 [Apophysomyces sp. BC1034]|nr:hypothetical protein DFQ29_001371 [Apophysomyces sp. BC1021]KAG0193742.1 hypothetical protein DFQ28_003662 [Apophysomyces sp. BC1034]